MTLGILIDVKTKAIAGRPFDVSMPTWIVDPVTGKNLASPAEIGWSNETYQLVAYEKLDLPEGKMVEGEISRTFDGKGLVIEAATLIDVPEEPEQPTLSPSEKIVRFLESIGVSLDDLKKALA